MNHKLADLFDLELIIIAGEKDETIGNDGANWQGRSVAERARKYFEAMKQLHGEMKKSGHRSRETPFRFQLVLLPEVGHDHVASAAAAQQRLFPTRPKTKGMVLRLDFDDGLLDLSGQHNKITTDASPRIGDDFAAFSSRGKQYLDITLNRDSDLLGCTELTIKARVRMNTQTRAHPFARIIQTSDKQWDGTCLMVNDKQQVIGWIQTSSPTRTANMFNNRPIKGRSPELVSKATLDDGRWHEVIMTYDGEVVRLFVDGQLQGRTRWAGGMVHFHQLNIGYVRSNGFHFDGDMDDLEIHGRALSPIPSND